MTRPQAITAALRQKGVDGVLISNRKNVHYLSGFTGSSAFLLISPKARLFITDFRYQEQAAREVPSDFKISVVNDNPEGFILEKARSLNISVLGFESTVSYGFYRSLLRKGVRLKALTGITEEIRRIKDQAEARLIGLAIARAEKAFTDIRPHIRPGATEREIALMLEAGLKKSGCRSLPFDIIVAAGKNSSMPHAHPTDNRIRAGDLVVIDWGGEADGYYSDMTRTLLMDGRNLSKKLEIYQTVLEANQAAIQAVGSGVQARTVDKTARDVIKKAGYGEFFGHGTGHGVGLDVHELPRISRVGRETIRPGMVFTIEPGIYVPGVGGVRIEDMITVKADSTAVLTSLSKTPDVIRS
ncbi:MAG: Xaa-Pro dipeptidase [Thermodesulfovibrio sp.]|nr:Xaa-Pro dipeptidase [Thermodesulfovibrio sp.]